MFYPTLSDYEDKTTASFWHSVFMEFSSLHAASKNTIFSVIVYVVFSHLKVSTFQKQSFLFSFETKNERH